MLISTQKGVGSQGYKWYKNEVHNRGAKVPFKSVVGSLSPSLPSGTKNTQSAVVMYTSFLYFYNEKLYLVWPLTHVEKIF